MNLLMDKKIFLILYDTWEDSQEHMAEIFSSTLQSLHGKQNPDHHKVELCGLFY